MVGVMPIGEDHCEASGKHGKLPCSSAGSGILDA